MRTLLIMISVTFILLNHSAKTLAQEIPLMSPITTKTARAIENKEPNWKYTPGVCTCPKLVPGQLSHDVGTWKREGKNGEQVYIYMDIYKIASIEEAAEWMNGIRNGTFGGKCRKEEYQIGDEGYLLDCPDDPRNTVSIRSNIKYRKGKFIVEVSGGSQDDVERFAKYAVEQLPDS